MEGKERDANDASQVGKDNQLEHNRPDTSIPPEAANDDPDPHRDRRNY